MAKNTLLPDFRNLGIQARAALLAEGLRLAYTVMATPEWRELGQTFMSGATLYEPVLLSTMATLAALGPALLRCTYSTGIAVVLATSALTTFAWLWLGQLLLPSSFHTSDALRPMLVALLTAGAVLFYFNWRHHRHSPAWAESRLMALQSRIRPHFLFNSLNSVLALIRSEPRKAEAMLEDLAELFRALLAEPRTLVPLSDELALARSYIAIEAIRLGDRLRVHWVCDPAVDATLVPPLLLQPLLENAVRYGVEPLEGGADVNVVVAREGNYLVLTVRNPLPAGDAAVVAAEDEARPDGGHDRRRAGSRDGNRMALANIKERLLLHFDAEAELRTAMEGGEHITRVRLPLSGKLKT